MDDDVYISIIPVYYMSKCFGLASYVPVKENGIRKFKNNLNYVVYGCIYTTCHVLCCFYISNFYYNFLGSEAILKSTLILQVNGLVLFVFTFLFIYICKHSKYVSVLNLILECDRSIKKFGIFIDYKYINTFSIKIMFFEVAVYLIMYVLMDFNSSSPNIALAFFRLLDTLLKLSILLYYEIFILMLQQRYLALNNILRMAIYYKTNKPTHFETVYHINILLKITQIYKYLFKIVKNVNDIYSVQLLVYIAIFFVNEVTHIYGACTTIIHAKNYKDLKNISNPVLWLSYYAVHIFIIIISSSKLTQNVCYSAISYIEFQIIIFVGKKIGINVMLFQKHIKR